MSASETSPQQAADATTGGAVPGYSPSEAASNSVVSPTLQGADSGAGEAMLVTTPNPAVPDAPAPAPAPAPPATAATAVVAAGTVAVDGLAAAAEAMARALQAEADGSGEQQRVPDGGDAGHLRTLAGCSSAELAASRPVGHLLDAFGRAILSARAGPVLPAVGALVSEWYSRDDGPLQLKVLRVAPALVLASWVARSRGDASPTADAMLLCMYAVEARRQDRKHASFRAPELDYDSPYHSAAELGGVLVALGHERVKQNVAMVPVELPEIAEASEADRPCFAGIVLERFCDELQALPHAAPVHFCDMAEMLCSPDPATVIFARAASAVSTARAAAVARADAEGSSTPDAQESATPIAAGAHDALQSGSAVQFFTGTDLADREGRPAALVRGMLSKHETKVKFPRLGHSRFFVLTPAALCYFLDEGDADISPDGYVRGKCSHKHTKRIGGEGASIPLHTIATVTARDPDSDTFVLTLGGRGNITLTADSSATAATWKESLNQWMHLRRQELAAGEAAFGRTGAVSADATPPVSFYAIPRECLPDKSLGETLPSALLRTLVAGLMLCRPFAVPPPPAVASSVLAGGAFSGDERPALARPVSIRAAPAEVRSRTYGRYCEKVALSCLWAIHDRALESLDAKLLILTSDALAADDDVEVL